MYVNNNGSMQCSGYINCLDSIYATTNIEAVGTMQCKSIITTGTNGIQIYSSGAVLASISQAGAIARTSMTLTSAINATSISTSSTILSNGNAVLTSISMCW